MPDMSKTMITAVGLRLCPNNRGLSNAADTPLHHSTVAALMRVSHFLVQVQLSQCMRCLAPAGLLPCRGPPPVANGPRARSNSTLHARECRSSPLTCRGHAVPLAAVSVNRLGPPRLSYNSGSLAAHPHTAAAVASRGGHHAASSSPVRTRWGFEPHPEIKRCTAIDANTRGPTRPGGVHCDAPHTRQKQCTQSTRHTSSTLSTP